MYLLQQDAMLGKTIKASDVIACMISDKKISNCLIVITSDYGIYMLGAGNYDLSKDRQSVNTFLSKYQKIEFLRTPEVRNFLHSNGITDNEIDTVVLPILNYQKELYQQIYRLETDINKKQTKLAALKNQADMD